MKEEFLEKAFEIAKNDFVDMINEMGIKDLGQDDIVMQKLWNLGSQILPKAEKEGMYEELYQLQGHNGLFIIGETISGFAAVNQLEFVLRHKESWYKKMIK